MKYDPSQIEPKWQAFWNENKSFHVTEEAGRPKFYVLDMYPYPSGSGLHVGHLVGYTATDVLARYKRKRGFSVLHPMGWDSFGLPAEQYAIRTGTHPAITTHVNIKRYHEQLEMMGYAYDWEREFATSDPSFYKWTQWIFTKLYEKGLAYQADLLVNYCPALGTVLANEEVEEGRSVEGGHPVERRPLRQWVLKITAYAERLLDDLDSLDWPEGLKKLQRNWIGRSEGAEISFDIQNKKEKIAVFTTRADTLFGVSYLVVAPEHPLLALITTDEEKEKVAHYQRETAKKSDLERTELEIEKSGVFTGAYALHPFTGKSIPIWVADYVLMGYGTGAVMAVPSHDTRDFAFAKKFHLPLYPVVEAEDPEIRKENVAGNLCFDGDGKAINSQFLDGLFTSEAKEKVIQELQKVGKGKKTISFRLRDWLFSRQRYWGEPFPILHFEDGSMRTLELDELPLQLPDLTDFKPSPEGESPLARVKDWMEITDPKTKKKARRDSNTMPQWAGSSWYFLRFCDARNEKEAWSKAKENYWMPVDLYVGGAEHAVLHLLYARFWHKVFFDIGLVSTKEPFQRLLNQGLVVARSFKRKEGGYFSPEEAVEREGKYFHWQSNEELESQIEKMSKSKLNVVNPDGVVKEYGADALRLYILFMGPIDKERVWQTEGVSGCRRFLNRFFEMATSDKVKEEENEEGMRLAHCLVHGVTEDLEKFYFNTAIAKMMEFINDFTKLPLYPKKAILMAVELLAPFAPHMTEELWQLLGQTTPLIDHSWPTFDPAYLQRAEVTYVIQVNGKLRGRLVLPKDKSEEEILKLALADPHIAKQVTGTIVKRVFVPNRLLNIVVE